MMGVMTFVWSAAAPLALAGRVRRDGARPPRSAPTRAAAGRRWRAQLPSSASARDSTPPTSPDSIDTLLERLRAQRSDAGSSAAAARVHLVGTGPGDASLLTLRALHHMQTADVILYDRLVSQEVLQLCARHAQLVYVGKRAGLHTRSQEDIQLLLAFFARRGDKVVRLKGGDALVFGRGGEEAQFLETRGVNVSVSAGITAAAGIAAELGVPLTMRGIADSVQFVTGHARDDADGEAEGDGMVRGSVDKRTTYVVYMGLSQMESVVQQLVRGGLSESTAAMAVERGTTDEQRVVTGTLSQLVQRVADAQLCSPTLVVVGDVVRLSSVWGLRLVRGRRLERVDAARVGERWAETERQRSKAERVRQA
ncbi:unnamed protein product [Agarophyton chilense]